MRIGAIAIGLLVGALIAALSVWGILAPLTEAVYRLQLGVRGPQVSSPEIVIIKIDEESIKQLGKFPWPRSRHAQLIERLHSMGARAIAFDLTFNDATPDDEEFAQACQQAGNVYVPVSINYTEMGTEYREPPSLIAQAVAGLGHIFLSSSADQTVSRVLLEHGAGKNGYFALGLLVSLAGLGIDESEILPPRSFGEQGAQYRLGPLRIPTDAYHRMWINYVGSRESFMQYSYADVLDGRMPVEGVHGKLVLVGVTISDYAAHYRVPIRTPEKTMTEVVVQANMIDTLLRQRFIAPLVTPLPLYPVILALWAGLLATISGRWRAITALTTLCAFLALPLFLFTRGRVFCDPSYLVFGLLLTYVGTTYLGVLRNMQRLRRFQAYAPPHLAVDRDGKESALEGERKRVAVLFADVKSFTMMAEQKDPRAVYNMMKDCVQILVEETYRAGGTIDKFTGDGVMALFGVPDPRPQDAESAVRAALNMQKALARYNEEHEKELDFPMRIRVGLNIGPVVIGDIGSDKRMDFTAMGDTVNVAARLEEATEPGTIMVSESIYQETAHLFFFKPLGPLRLKNRVRPVRTYEVIAERPKPYWEKRTLFRRRSSNASPQDSSEK